MTRGPGRQSSGVRKFGIAAGLAGCRVAAGENIGPWPDRGRILGRWMNRTPVAPVIPSSPSSLPPFTPRLRSRSRLSNLALPRHAPVGTFPAQPANLPGLRPFALPDCIGIYEHITIGL